MACFDPNTIICNANNLKDILGICGIDSLFEVFVKATAKTSVVEISCVSANGLEAKDKSRIFILVERNMKEQYEKNWGFKPEEKKKELFHAASRFLILRMKETSEIVAYAMFRFEWDDDDEPTFPVLYLYELQVATTHVRMGLGRALIDAAMKICKRSKMRKTMLTVFKTNKDAMAFYGSMGFIADTSSPSTAGFSAEYEILSKEP